MPFLSPNQQCQTIEGKNITFHGLAYPKLTWGSSNCLWPLIAPGYLGGGLPCLSSALWCQYPRTVKETVPYKWYVVQQLCEMHITPCETNPITTRRLATNKQIACQFLCYKNFNPRPLGSWHGKFSYHPTWSSCKMLLLFLTPRACIGPKNFDDAGALPFRTGCGWPLKTCPPSRVTVPKLVILE